MLIWVVLAGLTAIVLLVLLRPLAAAGTNDRKPEAFDAAVYRDQLSEIDSDRARGLIGAEEAEGARVEIARRLLAADSKARGSDRARARHRQGQSGDDRASARRCRCSRSASISPSALPACRTNRSPRGSRIPPAIAISKRWSPASRRASDNIPKKARAGR